ncbi:putative secondary metabolism biosynthetic enzyme [Exophiala oligosperma]
MSYDDLRGKTFIITGANSGQGRATALMLAEQGANLGLLDIVKPDDVVAEASKLKGGETLAFQVDVTNYSQVEEAVKTTSDCFGGIDGAANLAGTIGTQGWKGTGYSLNIIEDEDWDFMLGVNLNGVKNSIKAELKYIKDNGSIVNASSIAGQMGSATNAPYGAAKWGVIGLSKSAAQQGGARGIRVNAVAP